MDHRDREFLNDKTAHLQPESRREGLLLLSWRPYFSIGLAAGGLLFAHATARTASDDGKTALAFFSNGPGSTSR
jgi:hypothetical protein